MVLKVDMDKVVSSLSLPEKQAIGKLLCELNPAVENTAIKLNINTFREENGVNRVLMTNTFKILTVLGLVEAAGRGSNGTTLIVRNAEACKELKKILGSYV